MTDQQTNNAAAPGNSINNSSTAAAAAAATTPTKYASLNGGEEENELPLMLHVTAPASLPAGYTFEAEINGDPSRVFTCEVPDGGVEEGQLFLAPLPVGYSGSKRVNAPTGRWKDGLFDCWAPGWCHPSFWCALCCTQIAMGQAMSRMELTWLGEIGSRLDTRKTFQIVLALVVCYYVYSTSLELASLPYEPEEVPSLITLLKFTGNLLFTLWAIYSLCRVRENVRARYQIPEERCVGCEDFCCSFWCGCCTVAQVLRHTGEYEAYPGTCCTKTGHAPGTPLVV